jgi:hypothetical protein
LQLKLFITVRKPTQGGDKRVQVAFVGGITEICKHWTDACAIGGPSSNLGWATVRTVMGTKSTRYSVRWRPITAYTIHVLDCHCYKPQILTCNGLERTRRSESDSAALSTALSISNFEASQPLPCNFSILPPPSINFLWLTRPSRCLVAAQLVVRWL